MREASWQDGLKMKDYLANRDRFERLTGPLLTVRDGLLPFSAVDIERNGERYRLFLKADKAIRVFPDPVVADVVDLLVDMPCVLDAASFRATYAPSIHGSMQVFGPSFSKAIDAALSQGLVKAKFWIPDGNDIARSHSLLTHIRPVEGYGHQRLMQLEAWEYAPGLGSANTARYLHCMTPNFRDGVVHIDGALIAYSEAELETLLWGEKVLGNKVKYFRVDAEISLNKMHSLASAFFHSNTLYSEAMEIQAL